MTCLESFASYIFQMCLMFTVDIGILKTTTKLTCTVVLVSEAGCVVWLMHCVNATFSWVLMHWVNATFSWVLMHCVNATFSWVLMHCVNATFSWVLMHCVNATFTVHQHSTERCINTVHQHSTERCINSAAILNRVHVSDLYLYTG